MPKLPWGPPLNEHDKMVTEGFKPPYLWVSEYLCMAKFALTRGRAAFDRLRADGLLAEQEIIEKEQYYLLARAFVDEYGPLFPELDENGDCVVEGKENEDIERGVPR